MKRIVDIPVIRCGICDDLLPAQRLDVVRLHMTKLHKMDEGVSKIVGAGVEVKKEVDYVTVGNPF